MSDYKPGDKFIIEIESVGADDKGTFYRVKGLKQLLFSPESLEMLPQFDDKEKDLKKEQAYAEGYRLGSSDGAYKERARIKGKINDLINTLID